jgi:hypothetical protein
MGHVHVIICSTVHHAADLRARDEQASLPIQIRRHPRLFNDARGRLGRGCFARMARRAAARGGRKRGRPRIGVQPCWHRPRCSRHHFPHRRRPSPRSRSHHRFPRLRRPLTCRHPRRLNRCNAAANRCANSTSPATASFASMRAAMSRRWSRSGPIRKKSPSRSRDLRRGCLHPTPSSSKGGPAR